jgi:hypothetical protein
MKLSRLLHHDGFIGLSLTVLVIAAYFRALPVYFLSDDFAIIGKFIERHSVYFSFADFFRPLPLLSLWLDTQIFGLAPPWFRLENLLLHSLNAFLVYRLALQWLGKEALYPAVLSGILFAILPCHSEAVIWIACRPDLLATLFSLLCLLAYVRWLREHHMRFLTLAALTFLFAFLCKESAFALPLVLVVVTVYQSAWFPLTPQLKKLIPAAILFAAALLLQFLLRYLATGAWLGGEDSLITSTAPYLHNLFAFSYRTLLFPVTNAAQADFIARHATLISEIFLLLVLVVLELGQPALRKPALFLLLAFVAALLPVLHKTISLEDIDMERYLYLPSVFLCVLVAVVFSSSFWKKAGYLLAGFYIIVLINFLTANITRWNQASDIVVNSLRELREDFHADKLFVMGLPDSAGGVSVFRNGFPRAVMLFDEIPIRRKNILVPALLRIRDDNPTVVLTQDETSFHLAINDDSPSTLTLGDKLGVYRLESNSDHVMTVIYPDIAARDYQVMLYCDGQLRFYEHCPHPDEEKSP